ncbi:senescence-inducible chloroplast stay-green protein 1 [Panicum miliaceum]|uniref:Senescence-inducible chloroplast stay-green protein 1 n=1 Tax=Panicum miliaceum TaxID=4540 RepID=A0A3L6T5D0_PANMI|nr:senescence-inducible chloroplast stay-green protein 1 [Panicum miliaceum]
MAAATSASTMSLLPISQLKQQQQHGAVVVFRRRPRDARRRRYVVPTARLFGPAIFEASKLKVLFLGVDEESGKPGKQPTVLPRTYTLTHSDVTASLTLAVSHTINRAQLQGWYNRLQRDEVVAEWKKVRGRMSLHVHCHISGGHFLLDLIAGLRYYIFRKELPVVLKAFVHGDGDLFSRHPELEEATVWVYFHSNLPRFNRVECWGPLRDAAAPAGGDGSPAAEAGQTTTAMPVGEWPHRCPQQCDCCFPPHSLIPWPNEHDMAADAPAAGQAQQQ